MDHEKMMRAQLRSMGLGHLADFVTETMTEVAATAAPPFAHERDRATTETTVLHLLRTVSRFARFLSSRFATAQALDLRDGSMPSPELFELAAVVGQLTVSPYTVAAAEARITLLADPDAERATRRLLDITVELMLPVERVAYEAAKASPRMVGYLGTPSAPADWREWVVLHLQAQAADDAAPFFLAVVEDLWGSDLQSRREFRSEQDLAGVLIAVSVGAAGFALAADDAETGRTVAMSIEGEARAALDSIIRDFARHPAWPPAVTRHLHLVPPTSIYHKAAAALVQAASKVGPAGEAPERSARAGSSPRRHGRRWGR